MRLQLLALLLSPSLALAQDVPPPKAYSVSYTYDDTSRLTGADIADQLSIAYVYDASGRLLSSDHSAVSGIAIESEAGLPLEFALHQAYPNPFNPATAIGYDLPVPSDVRILVFDMLGRRVDMLVDERMPSGRHQARWRPEGRASGVYLVEMRVNERRFSQPVMLLN